MKSNVKNIICHCTTSTQVNAVKRHKENCIIYVYCRKIYNLFVRVSETGIKRAIRLTDSDCSLAIFKRRCLIRSRNFLPIASTWVHPRFFFKFLVGWVLLIFFFMLYYWRVSTFWAPCCDVRYDFHIKNDVRFVITSICLYEGACLVYVICVCLCMVVSNIYCVVFLVLFVFVLCTVPNFASFSGLSIRDCHFGFP